MCIKLFGSSSNMCPYCVIVNIGRIILKEKNVAKLYWKMRFLQVALKKHLWYFYCWMSSIFFMLIRKFWGPAFFHWIQNADTAKGKQSLIYVTLATCKCRGFSPFCTHTHADAGTSFLLPVKTHTGHPCRVSPPTTVKLMWKVLPVGYLNPDILFWLVKNAGYKSLGTYLSTLPTNIFYYFCLSSWHFLESLNRKC